MNVLKLGERLGYAGENVPPTRSRITYEQHDAAQGRGQNQVIAPSTRPCNNPQVAIKDYNYYRYSLWNADNDCYDALFSQGTIDLISKKVTELTRGLDTKGREIVVPDETIAKVLDGINQGYTRVVGDIYTRYFIQSDEQQNMVQSIIDQTIEVITNNVRNQYDMEKNNRTLTAWVQVYGDFNASSLRYHPIIKVRDRRPNTMEFHMNY